MIEVLLHCVRCQPPHATRPGVPLPQRWSTAGARASAIPVLAIAGILTHLALRWGSDVSPATTALPLYVVLGAGGLPLVLSLASKLFRRQFGSDLLAGISIVAAALLGEYLAGALVVWMRSGGEALESFALGRASSVLRALARRMALVAHRRVDPEAHISRLDAFLRTHESRKRLLCRKAPCAPF